MNNYIKQIFNNAQKFSLAGNRPHICTGDTLCWVNSAEADLFYLRQEGGLLPVCSFTAGEVFCASSGMQIGGRDGALIRVLPLDQLDIPAAILAEFSRHFLGCADKVIRALCPEMPDGVSYDGAGAALGPGGILRCSGQPSFVVVEGDGEYCGSMSTGDKQVLPFTRGSWLRSTGMLDIIAAEITPDSFIASLHYFTAFIANAAQKVCDREFAQWEEQSYKREENDRRIFKSALTSLAGVMETSANAVHGTDELGEVCSIVAQHSGVSIKSDDLVAVKNIEDFSLHFNCRCRRVRLKKDWHKHDCGSFVGFDGNRPVALIPCGDRYEIHYAYGIKSRLSSKKIEEISEWGWSFFQSLPEKMPGRRDILQLACKGSATELWYVAALGVLTGLLGMASPALTGTIVNNVIPSGSHGMMLQLSLGLMVAAIAGSLFGLVQNYCLLRFSSRSSFRVQASIWDRLLTLPASFFGKYEAGDLANRAMGIEDIRQILSQQFLSTALAVVVGGFNIIVAFSYSWQLSLVVLAFSIVGSLTGFAFSFFQLRYQRRMQEVSGKLQGMVLQFVTAISKIRVAGAESRAFSRWSSLFRQQKRFGFEYSIFSQLSSIMFAVLPLAQTALIFYVVTSFDEEHRLSTGAFMAFSAASAQFSAALSSLSSLAVALVEAIPHYERARPILEQKIEQTQAAQQEIYLKGNLEARGIDFSYENGSKVLGDVTIEAAQGEFVAVVGPSGSGKSTLLKVLLGLQNPQAGAVLFDGSELATLNIKSLRKQFGVVLQDGGIMQGSIFSNICGAKQLSQENAWKALEMAGLEQDVRDMPMGIHTVLPQGGGVLSGGQQQRLLIARALAGNPRILFFDEATSALDNCLQAEVSRNINNLNLTRIVIAHRMSTIRDADRIYVMDGGRVVQSGSYQELLGQEDGLFARLCMRQML